MKIIQIFSAVVEHEKQKFEFRKVKLKQDLIFFKLNNLHFKRYVECTYIILSNCFQWLMRETTLMQKRHHTKIFLRLVFEFLKL